MYSSMFRVYRLQNFRKCLYIRSGVQKPIGLFTKEKKYRLDEFNEKINRNSQMKNTAANNI